MCQNGQGGRGKGKNTGTFNQTNGETEDKGVWLSIWVDDVDTIHRLCMEQEIEVMNNNLIINIPLNKSSIRMQRNIHLVLEPLRINITKRSY